MTTKYRLHRVGTVRLSAARLGLTALFTAVVLGACWQPAFDPALSASTLTSSKMSLVSTITVTDMQEYRSAPGIFLPRRVARPTDGVWLHGDGLSGYEFESTAALYLKNAQTVTWFSTEFPRFNAAPTGWPIARMSPAIDESTPLETLVVATKSPSWGAAWLFEPIGARGSIALSPASPILPGSTTLIGAGFTVDNPTSDSMLMVYYDETTEVWMIGELSLPLILPPPVIFTTQPIAMPTGFAAPSGLSVGFAARSGTNHYLSAIDSVGAARTFRWPASLASVPGELDDITTPLVAALTDGTLLASDGMTMTAYDEAGTERYSFPAGSLRFVHERYDTTTASPRWMAVFCRTMFIRDQKDDNGTLRTEVFEIPVSDLPSLSP